METIFTVFVIFLFFLFAYLIFRPIFREYDKMINRANEDKNGDKNEKT